MSRRAAPLLVLLLLLSLPAFGYGGRLIVLFRASFDDPAGDASSANGELVQLFPAEVGTFETDAPDGAFIVEFPASGDGYLLANDLDSIEDIVLHAHLESVVTGAKLTTSATFTPQQRDADISMRISDESDTPLIDVGFTPGGDIVVAGAPVMPYAAGETYKVVVALQDPWWGGASYSVSISTPTGASTMVTGPLHLPNGKLTVKDVVIVLPGGGEGGEFHLDDLEVVAPLGWQTVLWPGS